jgi:dermatan/chondrotin sulfate uronyl 2-O-sulfotransferase UST
MSNEVNKLQMSLTTAQDELNNTMRAERQDLLIFNRVPKVGSQTMLKIINYMSTINNFTAYKDKGENVMKYGETTLMTPDDQRIDFCKMFDQFNYPATYTKHIAFIDFKELESLRGRREFARHFADFNYKFEQPIYINLVREPVNRIISWYYYNRAPWYIVDKKQDGSVGKGGLQILGKHGCI